MKRQDEAMQIGAISPDKGTWVVRVADGQGGNWTKAIGTADDFEDADNRTTFDFWQAQERARSVARTACGETDSSKPLTVAQALDRYKDDIETRSGDIGNMTRVKAHVPESLAQKNISHLTVRDRREWRDNLAKRLAPASVNRTGAAFRLYSEGSSLRSAVPLDWKMLSNDLITVFQGPCCPWGN
jgi:hypothetical protein